MLVRLPDRKSDQALGLRQRVHHLPWVARDELGQTFELVAKQGLGESFVEKREKDRVEKRRVFICFQT